MNIPPFPPPPIAAFAAIDPWIFSFSLATVVVTIWMGFWAAKKSKTASDFFVAGRSVSVGWNASAISGEYLSAASFMGVAGMVMSVGYDALWYPVCYACGYLFLLLFIAGPLRRFGAYTVPDFAEGRFDSPIFRKIAVVFVLFIGFFYTMPQMKGAGTTLAYIFPGLPYWVGVALVGAVITLNVALGGMKGITLVQAFQYWMKMFAISVPIFVLMAVYGHYGKQLDANEISARPAARIQSQTNSLEKKPLLSDAVLTRAFSKVVSRPALTNFAGRAQYWVRRVTKQNLPMPLPSPCPIGLASLVYFNNRLAAGETYTVYYDKSFGNGSLGWAQLSTTNVAPPASKSFRAVKAYLNQVFATNGVSMVLLAADTAAMLPTRDLTNYDLGTVTFDFPEVRRLLLPDKAPADSTWL